MGVCDFSVLQCYFTVSVCGLVQFISKFLIGESYGPFGYLETKGKEKRITAISNSTCFYVLQLHRSCLFPVHCDWYASNIDGIRMVSSVRSLVSV